MLGDGKVDIEGTTYLAKQGIVIATGTDPEAPDVRGLADTPYETNRDVVRWTACRRRSSSSEVARSV